MIMFSSGHKPGLIRRIDGQLSAGETLAEVVVAVAAQGQGETSGQKRPEALAARPLAVDGDGVLRSPSGFCRVISAPRRVPKVRSVLVSLILPLHFVPDAMAVLSSFFFSRTASSLVCSSLKS